MGCPLSSSGLDYIICLLLSQFTKLFYCERAHIAHIQSGDTLAAKSFPGQRLLAVNGASVKYRRQGDVVEMLKDITEVVELTVGLAKRMEEYSVSRNSQRGSVSGSHQVDF